MLDTLRDYQQLSIDKLKKSLSTKHKRPILVAPTGSGKTHIAVAVIHLALNKGNSVLFLAPRRELIYQARDRLADHNITSGIIMSGEPRSPYERVQIASFDTLHARGMRTDRMVMPDANVVIVDEAHLSIAATRKKIIDYYSDSVVIGLTATPARGDGKGLGEIYDDLIVSVSMSDLVKQGHLVPARYFAPSKPDLSKLKTSKGDYVVKELEKRVDKPQLVGEVIENWLNIAPDRQTVVFCVTRSHARHVLDEFLLRGIKAGYLDGDTPLEERKQVLADIASGDIQVLVNIFVATFGWDCPSISCVVLARPTKNITLYLQTAGRGLRTCDGKDDCIIIDHSGAIEQHGFVDDAIPWTLSGAEDVRELKKAQQKEYKEPKDITCKKCKTVFRSARICPNCGFQAIPKGRPIPVHKATLKELRKAGKAPQIDKQKFWNQCIYKAKYLNMKCGAAAHMYRKEFGTWPRGLDKLPKGSEWKLLAKDYLNG